MLSREDNERLVRVGPGAPMGELLRRFWLPALLERELAEANAGPLRLRLLGEELVAFRDSKGRVGILDAYCPHRRAHLYFGRNEDCGLRCVYHGWKFDVDGKCLDRPSEPPERRGNAANIDTRAYPVEIRGGVIWTYMGPPSLRPPLPDFEWSRVAPARRTVIKRWQHCNWAQAVEGGIDSSHVSFLHSSSEAKPKHGTNPHLFADKHPVFEIIERDFGMLIGARRAAGEDHYYWRITPFVLPFYSLIPPVTNADDSTGSPYDGHAWVPIDDENTWTWSFGASPQRDYTEEERAFHEGRDGMWGPVDENYLPLLNRSNDYGLDRAMQHRHNFTGIRGIPNQDCAVQESMGPITDRSRERLGSSDRAIVSFRRLMLGLARALEAGEEPNVALNANVSGAQSVSIVAPRVMKLESIADRLLAGRSPA